jgi:hypothetical protein
MTIADQLKQLLQAFQEWNKQFPGVTGIASDMNDLIAQLQLRQTPGSVRVVIMFHREEKRGRFEEGAFVDRYFWIVVTSPAGLKADPGARLMGGQAGGRPLYDVCESAREVIRQTSFLAATTEVTPDYKGMEPLHINQTTLTDAVRLEFSIGTQLPDAQ